LGSTDPVVGLYSLVDRGVLVNEIKRKLPPRWYVKDDNGQDLRWFYSKEEALRFLAGTTTHIEKRKREETLYVEDAPY
jgi:hypothetical protein